MSACHRFEDEGLLRLEQGLDLEEHFATCPDCQEARRRYQALQREIVTVGADPQPPPRWQARVWAEIAKRKTRRRAFVPWLRWLAPAALAAVLAGVLVLPSLLRDEPARLVVEVVADDEITRRGREAQPGDRLVLNAKTGGALHGELRVYLNDRDLVLRCFEDPPCRRRDEAVTATLVLSSVGVYQSVFLVSEEPLPPPSSSLDSDVDDALRAGARYELGEEVEVR